MDPRAFEGRKRARSDDSTDDSYLNTTLIGGFWPGAGSHIGNISTRHQQQRRRLFREASLGPPSVPVWGPESFRALDASSPARLDTVDRASADGSESSHLQSSPASPYGVPSAFLPSPKLSSPCGQMMFERQRYQQRAAAEHRADAGSSSSRTLRGSPGIPHAASYLGPLGPMFDTPDHLSYTAASDAPGSYPLTQDCPEIPDLGKRPGSLLTQGQAGQYSRILPQQEIDPPWSHIDASYSHTSLLTQRPRRSWAGEVPENSFNEFLVQPINSSAAYPSQISSPMSSTSRHPSEMVLTIPSLQLPDSFPNYMYNQDFHFGEDPIFQENHDLSSTQALHGPERENTQFLPLVYNSPTLSSDFSRKPFDMSKSFHPISEDFTLTDWSTPLTEQNSSYLNRNTNNYLSSPGPTPQGLDDQCQPSAQAAVPRTSKDRKWEHTIVSDGLFKQLGNQTTSKVGKKKTGRRKGPLPADAARKASEVRHNRACWRCWLLHIACSVDRVCSTCQNPSSFRVCNKVHLYDYTGLFFPELVVARRHPSAVERLIDENVLEFTTNKIQVHLSSGSNSSPITIMVYEFIPENTEFLFLYWVPPDIETATQPPGRIYAPPLGLLSKDEGKLRDSCREHIKTLVKQPEYCKDATDGDAVPMSWEIYQVVTRYRKSKRMLGNADLIRKVVKLHAMHFFMSRIIDFTPDSAKKVAENLRSPGQSPYKHNASSKLLTHQIKREINILQHELTLEILEELQKELRRRSKTSWATCLCVILILSMCMEAIQVSVDGFITLKMLENDGNNSPPISRDDGFEISRHLDERPFKDCMEIFHMIYRSGETRTGAGKREFNPIRDGIQLDKAQGIDEDTVQLVNELRAIVSKYRMSKTVGQKALLKTNGFPDEDIEERARNPSCHSSGDVLADHYRFRRENSGRLVARFLKSFQEPS